MPSKASIKTVSRSGGSTVRIGQEKHSFGFKLQQLKENAWSLAVDAANAAVEVPAALAVAAKMLVKRPAMAAAGAAIGVGAAIPRSANAAFEPDGSNDANYVNYGKQFQGRLFWLQIVTNGQLGYVSAVQVNSEYLLTAAHNVDISGFGVATPSGSTSNFHIGLVGNGSNFNTAQGTTDTISNITVNPTYNYTQDGGSQDIAILKLAAPITTTSISLTGSAPGDQIIMGGFGYTGTPSTGIGNQDGNSRAWIGTEESFRQSDGYFQVPFGNINDGEAKAFPGDSGGFGFIAAPGDPAGYELAGLLEYQTGNLSPAGASGLIDFGDSGLRTWENANTVEMPEPTLFSLTVVGSGAVLLTRQRKARNNC